LAAWLAGWSEWVRWVGVAYLLYLGTRQWIAALVDLTRTYPPPALAPRHRAARGPDLTHQSEDVSVLRRVPSAVARPDAPIVPQIAATAFARLALPSGVPVMAIVG
jgi:hypothetical protein